MTEGEILIKQAVLEERRRILNILHDAKLRNGFKAPLSSREEEYVGHVLGNIIDAVHNKTSYEKVPLRLAAKRKS